MSERGRPSKYNPEFHRPWVKSLASRGLTVAEIAKEIGVAKSTLCLWVKDDPELSDALNKGRGAVDSQVEQTLLKRALGFTVTEKKTIVSAGDEGQKKPLRVEIYEKEIPPDTTACIYWLKNRRPDLWRDVTEHAIEVIDDNARSVVEDLLKEK